jgi:glyceraldehyde-3-phosphate dehydrogenase (NADP+)
MNTLEKINNLFPEDKQIPVEFNITEEIHQTEYLVNGEIRNWNGANKPVFSAVCVKSQGIITRKKIGSYPMLEEKEALEALDSAVTAFNHGRGLWPTMSVEERIKHVEDFAFQMTQKKAEVVKLLMWEIGKSYADSEKEFDRTIEYIKDTIDSLKEQDHSASRFVVSQGIIAQIRRAPLGVALCMGPYNYPLNETYATFIPALLMGNTVVFKPAKFGVLLHKPLLEAYQKSFPAGVVNIVYGEGHKIITPMMESGKVDVLAFIGSSKVADVLKKQHPKPHRLRCVLGLDAKNVGIVMHDADIDMAVKECLLGSLSYNGQRCTALKILYVHSKIADSFIAKYIDGLGKLNIGMPWENKVDITPLPDPGKPEYLTGLVNDALSHGAKVINENGGKVSESFFYPAVLYPVNLKMRVAFEEQFGPVVPIVAFDQIDEPLNYIIESNFGQQVSIFSKDPEIIAELVDPLVNQVSRVNINSQCQRGPDIFPFTGRKDSAEGTLSVSDALRAFSIRTMIAAKGSDINKEIITKIARENKSNFISTNFIL